MKVNLAFMMRCVQQRTIVTTLAISLFLTNFIISLKLLFDNSPPNEDVPKASYDKIFINNKVFHRAQREEKVNQKQPNKDETQETFKNKTENLQDKPKWHKTDLNDIFISIKTTNRNHKTRLKLLLNTWVELAINQTYVFTDSEDPNLKSVFPKGHVINTNCSSRHSRTALCCKMALEYDIYMNSNKRWFCHVDDDTYLNVPTLVEVLRKYNHTSDWYLGKPSLKHPIEIEDRDNPGQRIAFWFATGGAGFCISQALAFKMIPYAGGGKFMTAGEQIRLPDDCTIGYIIEYLLHKELTVIKEFHSHLEGLGQIKLTDIKKQITFSYYADSTRTNVVDIKGYPLGEDPTRFHSIHCHLHPYLTRCVQ